MLIIILRWKIVRDVMNMPFICVLPPRYSWWRNHFILYNKKKGYNPNEFLGINLTSEQIFNIVEEFTINIR